MACNAVRFRAAARSEILRIALDPGDAVRGAIVQHAQRLLEAALRDRTALTYANAARALSAAPAAADRVPRTGSAPGSPEAAPARLVA
jgi:hypothetical protein